MFSRRTDWKLAPNRLTMALDEVRASGLQPIDLTISNPTRAGVTYNAPAILDSLRSFRALDYDPQPKGLADARQAVAEYYQSRREQVDPEALVLTSGTSEGYSYLFRLLANPGDEILVPKPSYPLFDFLADLEDVKPVPYPLLYDHGWQIDFHCLQKAIGPETRGIVLVNPNNPTGSYVSSREREELNEICRLHNLALIVDEVFLDYAWDGSEHPSFTANRGVLTFTLSGLSKISALPQMKLAWIAVSGPNHHVHSALERLEVIADTYLSVSTPVQFAARALLAESDRVQSQIGERVRANLRELDRQLSLEHTCSSLAVEGGWYSVLRVPVTQPDEDLAIALLREENLLVHPGHFYDFPQDGFLVLSLISPEQDFGSGVQKLLRHISAS